MSNLSKYAKEQSSTHRFGSIGQHLPGNETTLWYSSKKAAVDCCKDTNRQPWNRNNNRAGLVLPSGEITRSY